MTQASFGWDALLVLILLWIGCITLAVLVLDLIFPRIYRNSADDLPPIEPIMRRDLVLETDFARPTMVIRPPMPTPPETPPHIQHYWRANLRLVAVLLVIWFLSFALPAVFAAALNQYQILNGFPLGYYMGAQGSLLIFLILIFWYAWRMSQLDNRYNLVTTALSGAERRFHRLLLSAYGGFAIGLLLMIAVLIMLERNNALSPVVIGWSFPALTVLVYAAIGLFTHSHTLDDYYVASRSIPGGINGLATGSDWMSAASFISMAGTLWLLGYEGLAYIIGWTGGYVLLALLLVPYLRAFGQYTVADFIGARYGGNIARVVGAITSIIISFTYVTAQVTGIGIIMSYFLGVNYLLGVFIGLAAVLICSFLGGMKAVTWTQVAQGIILVIAYIVPVTWLSLKLTGVPFPQIMYGEALGHIELLEQAQGITKSYVTPFNDWSSANFLALALCLMLGTAGMPHILVRFYTVRSVSESRKSVGWALLWISLLYFTAPAYAAFSRWDMLQNVVNQPIAELPSWTETWARTGLLTISDVNGDGRLQFNELRISPDLVVLATPDIAGLPRTVGALVAAGGLAAALSTADGLLLVISSAVAHDIYFRAVNPLASARSRLLLGRLMVLAAAVCAALAAIQQLGIIVQLVAWAFSIAAASFFPALVLGIFSKQVNGKGAVAGMIAGMVVTLVYMVLNYTNPAFNLWGISHVAAGIFGVPVNFLLSWLVSRLTTPPSPRVRSFINTLRHP